MFRAMEGQKLLLRPRILWVFFISVLFIGLNFYKSAALNHLAQEGVDSLRTRHAKVLGLFQASFYFFYEDQFVPGIRQNLARSQPRIKRIQILSSGSQLSFDSDHPEKERKGATEATPKEILAALNGSEPAVFVRGFEVQVLMPSGAYGVLYVFDGAPIRNHLLIAFLAAVLGALLLTWAFSRRLTSKLLVHASYVWNRVWGLRVKFLATIVLINAITAIIVFWSLSALQTRDQSRRIEKESQLFAEYSTAQVISDFTNFFYFYYGDRFLPGLKRIIASNDNLLGIRVISARNKAVLFDSETATTNPSTGNLQELPRVEFSEDILADLKTREVSARHLHRNGEKLLSVVSAFRGDTQEPLFWVEYLFTFQSLEKSIQAIRRQILVDLVPSLLLSLLIAILFARLMIAPIRKLVSALQSVTQGDFDVSVDIRKSDEIGELVSAFNTMTSELRKKKELRKYLSDSTYRQIMEAPDSPDGIRLGGSRVSATILFSDIRNFVSHCETLEAEEVTAMLNEYFTEMVEVVHKHGGEVDKFIGDALLAVFYATDEDRAGRWGEAGRKASAEVTAIEAVYCAMEMRERLGEFNRKRRALHKETIEIGVGISHGEIISGPIGAKDRMDFTVIGDVVNLASRIEKLSKIGKHTKILFSDSIETRVRGLLDYAEVQTGGIRGKEEEIQVFELIGIRDVQVLIKNLESPDTGLRRRSIELLGLSNNREVVPELIAAMDDPDEVNRIQVILSLVKLGTADDEKVLAPLFAKLNQEKSERVLSVLISGIGRLCTTEKMLGLARFLKHKEERVVANAIEAIGQVKSPKCTDLILPELASPNNRIKANAAMALFAAGRVEVLGTLKPMLLHSEPLMRSSAAFVLGELTLLAEKEKVLINLKNREYQHVRSFLAEIQECVPMLVALLGDQDPMVKRQAVIALGKIKDKSSVLAIIDQIDPKKDSKELIRDMVQALRSIGSHKLVREVLTKFT